MAERTAIEWCDSTHNFWIGCTNVSEGCRRCYAERLATKYGWAKWGPHEERRRTSAENWRKPLRWNADTRRFQRVHGRRQRVFANSLSDVFDNAVPPAWRADLWALIRATPDLDWLLLSKRPQNMAKMLPPDWRAGWPHVWLGTTTEDEANYRLRWPVLACVPAARRFISYEPALGPLRIAAGPCPDWIIIGAESGPGARFANPQWVRDVLADAKGRAACFVKQLSTPGGGVVKDIARFPPDLRVRRFPPSALRADELDLISDLERLDGRKLTPEQINLSLDQAREIGEL